MFSIEENKILEKMVLDYGFSYVLSALGALAAKQADECADMQLKDKSVGLSQISDLISETERTCGEIEGNSDI